MMSAYGKITWQFFGLAMTSLLADAFALTGVPAQAQPPSAKAIYVTDMSRCQPQAALSPHLKQDCWRLIPYKTVESSPGGGTMIGAISYIDAPDVTLPLNVTGWHAVYVGFWNPHYAYDSGTTVKVKLNDDPCFTRIAEPEPAIDYNATYIKEAPFKAADLTGRTLQFGMVHGRFAKKAYIAYVKLVPLSAQQVADLQAERARKDTRVLRGTIDGYSYFSSNEYRTREHIMELIEPYRYSDVGKIIWSINVYGDQTNYPTKVGTYWAEQRAVPIVSAKSDYVAGEKAAYDSLRSLAEKNIIPEAVAAEHAHAMGLKFDVMFRMGVTGEIPPANGPKSFVLTHPQFRQVMRDGTPIEKASYAFPEVRNLVVSIIREAAETFDIDGVNLCFMRGPEFMAYEKPVLDDFRKKYHEDARKVAFDDPRMRDIHCHYLNKFVRNVRQTLDEVGKKKGGKKLELSAMGLGVPNVNIGHGMDTEYWIKQGWLDGGLINVVWDIDSQQDSLTLWPVLQRSGHPKAEQAAPTPLTTVRLKTVGGCDVLQGLREAVYSGG
jgi:hypothetical protein